jgi:hypothetical protein
MTQTFLIDINDVKLIGLVHDNIDTKLLKYCIWISQEMNVQEALGTALYKEMLRREEDNDWDADYTLLKDEYISKVIIAGTDYNYTIKGSNRLNNKGVGRIADENQQANSNSDNFTVKQELTRVLEFYTNKLIGFLKDNCDIYTEYKNSNCDYESTKPKKQGGFKAWG